MESNVRTPSAEELLALRLLVQAYHPAPELAALGAVTGSQIGGRTNPVLSRAAQIFQAGQAALRPAEPPPGPIQQLGIRG